MSVSKFSIYIVRSCEGTDITHNNKCMCFRTGLLPDFCIFIQKSEVYFTFDVCIEAGVKAEMALCLNAEYNKALKSVPRGKAPDKASDG
jgi:hypothetical protein